MELTQNRNWWLVWLGIFSFSVAACTGSVPKDQKVAGQIEALVTAPPDGSGRCIVESVRNVVTGRTVTAVAELGLPGDETVVTVADASAGDVELTARVTAGFANGACTGAVTWVAEAILLKLIPGESRSVTQLLLSRADVAVRPDYEDIYGAAGAGGGGNGGIDFRDDFNADLSPAEWATSFTAGGANVFVDATNGTLVLETVPNTGCATAEAHGLRQASVADGALVFDSLVLDAYVDQGIYGDAQPRGLVAGTDRSNAIEFINAYPVPNNVTCRTVADGVATETTVDIGQSVRSPADYRIVATSSQVEFFVNGNPVATHTTNIPNAPLNVYYSTGDSCAGNVPVTVDWVSFQTAP